MTYLGSDNPPSGQPGQQPYQGQPEKKSGVVRKVVLPVVGGLVALGAAGTAFGLIGGNPGVGDCVRMAGETSFESVDCGSDEAEYKITGVDEQELNRLEFDESDEVCMEFESSEVALWIGDYESDPGTVYCAEGV